MTLLLSNADVEAAADLGQCLGALEAAYRELAAGATLAGERADVFCATSPPGDAYNIKVMTGAYEQGRVSTVRLTSDVLAWREDERGRRRTKLPRAPGGRWTGLVLLFSTDTGEPLMLCPDGVLQRIRVGATSALAVKHMANGSAKRIAIIGSGWQARGHALALAKVLDLQALRCFSPSPDRRHAFVAEMGERLDCEVTAVESAEVAVAGVDVVVCATNSLVPVLEPRWLAPGQIVVSIREGELHPEIVAHADRIVVHHRANLAADRIAAAPGVAVGDRATLTESEPRMERALAAPELATLIAEGLAAGADRAMVDPGAGEVRENPTSGQYVFLNHHGIALQFAAVGAVVRRNAVSLGLGHELPTHWLTQDVHP